MVSASVLALIPPMMGYCGLEGSEKQKQQQKHKTNKPFSMVLLFRVFNGRHRKETRMFTQFLMKQSWRLFNIS